MRSCLVRIGRLRLGKLPQPTRFSLAFQLLGDTPLTDDKFVRSDVPDLEPPRSLHAPVSSSAPPLTTSAAAFRFVPLVSIPTPDSRVCVVRVETSMGHSHID